MLNELKGSALAGIVLLTVLLATVQAAQDQREPASSPPSYLDPGKPLGQRVDDLVGRMTLEEKASQMVNGAKAIPRLNVPAYNWWSEALHGVMAIGKTMTVFPEPIGLAASFNTPLVKNVAIAIGDEGRAYYNVTGHNGAHDLFQGLTFYSPNINIFRDPRWGRGQETYGEDPWLTATMAVGYITGLQGDDPSYLRASATAKHFAVYSGPEFGRLKFDAQVSRHDLEDTYLPPFRAAVLEGRVRSIMCDYYSLNGVPSCANEALLNEILRQKWQFKGFVASDCGAVTNIQTQHHYVQSAADARAAAVRAGVDSECTSDPVGSSEAQVQAYLQAVRSGKLREADLDVALKRMFTIRFALGMFDPQDKVKYAQTPASVLESDAHRALAVEAADESMVLLKNNGALPFSGAVKKIAVFGTLADQVPVLLGNYNGTPAKPVTALTGIKRQFSSAEIVYEPGTNFGVVPSFVPPDVLSTDAGKTGLTAEFFDNDALSGPPVETRIDQQVRVFPDFRAGSQSARTAVRWSGWLTPKESGSYQLGLQGSSNVLYLDGQALVDARGLHAPYTDLHEVQLVAGQKYRILVESPQTPFRVVQLVWCRNVERPQLNERIAAAASGADVAVAVVGLTSELESEESGRDDPGFKGGDRTSLDLPREEQQMLEAIKATGKPLVVVLMNGSALSVNWAAQHADAILEAWYPGQEGGTAIARTLAGLNNPAGRLPVTFYKGVEQLPSFEDYSMARRTYRYFPDAPLYPFGYGLSYSRFAYSALKLSSRSLEVGDPLRVSARVKNTSDRDGDDVVQLYLTFPKLPGAPLRALRGFTRIHLAAGEIKPVEFQLGSRDLSYVNEAGEPLVGAGNYEVAVGGGQPAARVPHVSGSLKIKGELRLPP